jgi:hypothetical protein
MKKIISKTRTMKNIKIYLLAIVGLSISSCIDNNNKDNNSGAKASESDYIQDAPTTNETRDDMEEKLDTVNSEKRVPNDPVERASKGNAASK